MWRSGNQSSNVSSDAQSGVWAAPSSDSTGASGAWQRVYDGVVIPHWFGAAGDGTDQATALHAWADRYKLGESLYAPPGAYGTSVEITVMPYNTAPTATTQTPRPTIRFDRKAIFKASAAITSVLTFGSTASDYTGCFFDGLVEGGTFDANFLATNCIRAPFVRQFRVDGAECRNAVGQYIKIGSDSSPATSFEGIVTNCRTGRDLITLNISGITKANPGVITFSAAHGLTTGDVLCLTSIGGMTELEGTYVTATVTSSTQVSIGVNTSGYTTYTSGGYGYKTVMGTSITGVYFENCTDNHAHNCILTGTEIGLDGLTVAGTLGIYNAKIALCHAWNYLENGRILYGFAVGGDCTLMGCQVDGPFSYAYRWRALGNKAYGCGANYTPLTYGGRDNTDYTDKVETGGGVTHFGPQWIAQSASARLAGTISGDTTNWAYYAPHTANIVATVLDADDIHSTNATVNRARRNLDTGASAIVMDTLASNNGSMSRFAYSTAGGGQAWDDWSGTGDRYWSAGNSGARQIFQYGYVDKFVVGSSSGAANLSTVGIGYGHTEGVGGTVTQGSGSGKATGVTLDKVCGRIKTDNATLNAGTSVSFTFTNSTIAATDLLILNHVGGGTGTQGAYTFHAACANGSANITIRNVTAGNLSEAIDMSFAVFKAVTS